MSATESLVQAALAEFDIPPERFHGHQFLGDDEVEARACVCWALRQLGMTLQAIAWELKYHDYQRPSVLIRRVESTPRLLRRAKRMIGEGTCQ